MRPSICNDKFIGGRLTQARLIRGMSQTQLAELSGIKKQSISNYENGKQTPRADNIEILCEKLSVPIAFFQKKLNLYSDNTIFFRSRKGLALREWNRAKIKLQWLEELLNYFNDYVNFVHSNIPNSFDISTRLGKVNDQEIEEIAIQFRKFWNLGFGPISNMATLLENNGIIIVKMPLEVKDEDAFSQWQLDKSIPVVCMVTDNPSACRDRFSLAHELGHLVLHQNIDITDTNINIIEHQANLFASSFLLPAPSYLKEFCYPSLEIFKTLKDRWKVSISAQINRCKKLNVINDNCARNLYINMAKRKWLKTEPLDDIIKCEKPTVLNKIINVISNNFGYTVEDIAASLQLPKNDILQFCNYDISSYNHESDVKDRNCKILRFQRKT